MLLKVASSNAPKKALNITEQELYYEQSQLQFILVF